MKIKTLLTRGKFWMNITAVMACSMMVVILALMFLNIYTRHGQGVEVPDVKGLQCSDAMFRLHEDYLEGLVVDSDYVKGIKPGTVLEQTPSPGLKVKNNRTIFLTVNSSSSPTRSLPDLADNSSLRQATVKLKAMGFNLAPVELMDGEKDWVYAIKYRGRKVFAGDRIPSDATLTLVVGSGLYGGDADSTLKFTIDDIGDYGHGDGNPTNAEAQ